MARRRRRRKGKPRGRAGRKPTGLQPGEKVSEYPRLTVRAPERTVERLRAAAAAKNLTQWQALVEAIEQYAARVLTG